LIFRSPVLTLLKAEAIIIERRSTADASVLLSDSGVPFYNALKILGDQQFPEGKFHGILLDMEAERAMDLLAAVSRNIAAGFIKSLEKSAQKAEAAEPDKKGTAVFLKRPRIAGS
jgi:hypothetical protein